MLLGVDYYPEQWPSHMLEADMDRILELGCNVIRIGEFAWCRMEPVENQYDFSYFDGVIAMARKKGLQVILGTPTATPPAWLIRKHPDILSQFEGGTPRAFGGRHVSCYSSVPYREHCAQIITHLAEHYKNEPAIAAWQIDNELGHEGSDQCWCPRCRAVFQNFLKEKFNGDVQALNQTYGTVFWSQEYDRFEDIPLPSPTITTHNPALRLDWESALSEESPWLPPEAYVTILGNLIENAIEGLNQSRCTTKEISVSIREGEDSLLLCVEDTGPGIPAELRETLFQRGVSTKGRSRGTGLSLVHEVVEAYHGEIRVESESGVGTSFFLSFCRENGPVDKE